jgi:hypothetical protein
VKAKAVLTNASQRILIQDTGDKDVSGSIIRLKASKKIDPIDIIIPVTISGEVSRRLLTDLPTMEDIALVIRLTNAITSPIIDTPTKSRGKKYRRTPNIPRRTRPVSNLVGFSPIHGIARKSTRRGVMLSTNENVIAGKYKRPRNCPP